MRNRPTIVALVTFLIALFSVARPAPAQQAIPDAPQPQKKAAPKQPPPAPPAATPEAAPEPHTNKTPPSKDDNAFPEAESKAAADAAAQDKGSPAAPAENDKPAASHTTADDNPFPEAVSKAAAKAAASDPDQPTPAKPDLRPGESSSQATSADLDSPPTAVIQDPARAKKDNEVGRFYLSTGNLQGALTRFQEATAADPTNIDAIFGVAEAQRMLGKNADAARQYQMYLDIVPDGPRAKDAIKALKTLQTK